MSGSRLAFAIWRVGRHVQNIVLFPISFALITLLLATRRRFPNLVMPMNTSRVGHLGIDVEYALSDLARRPPGDRPGLIIVPFRVDLPVANRILKRMWCRVTPSIPATIGVPLVWTISRLGLDSRLLYLPPKGIANRFNWGSDPYGVTAGGVAHLRFTHRQVGKAERQLQQMGLDLSKPFVCLHVRDNQYHAKHSGGIWTETHNWRNIPLCSFEEAAKLLVTRGFQVVRIGVHAAETFRAADEKEVFDYANNGWRDELLDVFLVSRCSFMISTSSGIDSLTQTFRKPLYNVGVIAPSQLYIHRNIFSIVQRFESAVEGRALTLSETFALPKINDESLCQMGLRAVVNTPDEITQLAAEASDREYGVWSPTEEQIELQQRFLALLPSEFRRFPVRGGIGSHFLSAHRDWLN